MKISAFSKATSVCCCRFSMSACLKGETFILAVSGPRRKSVRQDRGRGARRRTPEGTSAFRSRSARS
jgi:hypothetical protein